MQPTILARGEPAPEAALFQRLIAEVPEPV
jgi:hypothetical protein